MVEPMEATDDSDNMAEVTEEEEVDRGVLWSQLLPELLRFISRKLPDTRDFVRFRAVCTAWRDAAPVSNPPAQLPWIVQCGQRRIGDLARPRLSFYSHSSGRTYHTPVGGRRSLLLAHGLFQGQVVATVDLSATILYNPFTGERRALPPAPYLQWSDDEALDAPYAPGPPASGVFTMVLDDGAGCVVANTCTRTRHFAYFRSGVDAGWRVFDRSKNLGANTYHGGRLYANTATRETLAIDAATGAVEAVVQRPLGENFRSARGDHLVGSTRGKKLLRAIKQPRCDTQPASDTDVYFNVYELDVPAAAAAAGGKQAAWTKVDTIGDAVLFIDDYGQGFSMEPNDAAGLRRDCVYFMHVKWTWSWQYRFLCRYNMEDGRVDKAVPLGETFGETWIVPSLCYSDE